MDGYCYQLIMIQIRNILQYLIFMVDLELHMGNLSSMKCRSGRVKDILYSSQILEDLMEEAMRLRIVVDCMEMLTIRI